MKKVSLMIVLFAIALSAIPCMALCESETIVAPSAVKIGEPVEFNLICLEPGVSYKLEYGDGETYEFEADSDSLTVYHTYYSEYVYDVKLTLTTTVVVDSITLPIVPNPPYKNDNLIIDMDENWNTFSTPLPLLDEYCVNVFNTYSPEDGFEGDIDIVMNWTGEKWRTVGSWESIRPGFGYYVHATAPGTVELVTDFQNDDFYAYAPINNNEYNLVGYVPYYDGYTFKQRDYSKLMNSSYDFILSDVITIGIGFGYIEDNPLGLRGNEFVAYNNDAIYDMDRNVITIGEDFFKLGDAYWIYKGSEEGNIGSLCYLESIENNRLVV